MSEYFSLSDCDVIGFDLDHTLCRYHLKETSRLIYESFARYLVEHKGYDKDLLNLTPATWDFCFKGLVVDLEDGNLVKLAEDGTVLRVTHGTNDLSTEEIIKHYGPKREWKHFNSLNTSFTRSANYYFYDNYFDLPGALLCGRVVDMLHKRGNEVNSDFWKDMVAAIDHNYNTSAFKATQQQHMAHYTSSPPPAAHPSVRARLQLGFPHCANLKSRKKKKKAILPGRFTLQRNSGGVGRLLSRYRAVISLVVESVCLSGSCCFPGHWPQGIYTEPLFQHREGSTSCGRPLPALMSSLMMGAMSSGGMSLQGDGPPFSSPSPFSLFMWFPLPAAGGGGVLSDPPSL